MFLGYWLLSLIIWCFLMKITIVTVIIFGFIGYHIVCKPLAFLLHKTKKFITDYFFNGFNIFEAYYAGFELGRIVRIVVKYTYFIITLIIAKVFQEGYLAFF
jgi:hypothetical protein